MLNSILATACLIGTVCFYIDLKIDKWEWTDQQRKRYFALCAAGAVFFAWSATWHPILVRSAVALVAAIALGITARDWYQRVKRGAILTKTQLREKQVICAVALVVLFSMLKQISYYRMIF